MIGTDTNRCKSDLGIVQTGLLYWNKSNFRCNDFNIEIWVSLLKISNSWKPSNFQISFCCHVSFKWGYIQISAKNFPDGNELNHYSYYWKPTWWLLNFLNLFYLCRVWISNQHYLQLPIGSKATLHLQLHLLSP